MRTTIKIDDTLLAEAKSQAADSGRTLNMVVEDALREVLRPPRASHAHGSPELPSFVVARLVAGTDLDDSAALLEHDGEGRTLILLDVNVLVQAFHEGAPHTGSTAHGWSRPSPRTSRSAFPNSS